MSEKKTLGQVAFDAYHARTKDWDANEHSHAHWEAVASAVLAHASEPSEQEQNEFFAAIDADKNIGLRDYFAAKADLSKDIERDGCIEQRLAVALMDGKNPPNWDDDFLAARIWWLEAEMRLRYMKADLMMKVREE
jgi:hypothetical protein